MQKHKFPSPGHDEQRGITFVNAHSVVATENDFGPSNTAIDQFYRNFLSIFSPHCVPLNRF